MKTAPLAIVSRSRRSSLRQCSSALAAAFAFATVLTLAAHVTGAATALAFATVHAFAVVLACAGAGGGRPGVVARAAGDAQGRACHQPSHGGGQNQRSCGSIQVHSVRFGITFLFYEERVVSGRSALPGVSWDSAIPYTQV